MEGLLLARTVRDLQEKLPVRGLGWVFPDETTAALLLEGLGNLVLSYRPPQPGLFVSRERLSGEARTSFQRVLSGRARGELVGITQLKLDRVVQLSFSGERGFVDVPPMRLVFELTGRNTNIVLLEPGEGWDGSIVGAAREITHSRNRFRSVRVGGRYTPPPPYEKFDPRRLGEEEARGLSELPLGRWRDRIDGLGLGLGAELCRRAGIPPAQAPAERWPDALRALRSLVENPTVQEGALAEGVREAVRSEKAEALRKSLREPLTKRRALLHNQLGDVERALQAYETAQHERNQADLLMAYAHRVPPGAFEVELPDFSGEGNVTLSLEPHFSAMQNAEKLYARARRREEVFDRLVLREPALRGELSEVEDQLARLEQLELSELEALARGAVSPRSDRPVLGWRFVSPSGFEVLVGRNNKENDVLTHRVGKSLDYWFHVQGFPGSHVLVRTNGRELALPDILMAASVAAYHSKARGDANVAVDYTRVKNVWKPRGAPAGKVLYTQQKTVFVDPALPADTP
ncbi:Rqc2 family fibronectin-binding protein [Deinococcus peraridilitoris]|uniref:Putative RNA-binding protein, snRNP like protein n=1 Tax=Deinococcus peraridilitoris (strain DSM 19664 / LMG 22246 / CIP 109416 / KR-200) TaxID=937777 RepID=L0A7D8_DEIPD|nr:NFACT family protein [Deinococcus peraridilitoris]AFZ68975.1 putative RNA-binding protein, snRNP like protein [Deinococcus peraridilitoris DSM 19664]